jgi:hypothetical protein
MGGTKDGYQNFVDDILMLCPSVILNNVTIMDGVGRGICDILSKYMRKNLKRFRA